MCVSKPNDPKADFPCPSVSQPNVGESQIHRPSMNCRNCSAPLSVTVGPARLICDYCQTVQTALDVADDLDRVQILGTPQGVTCPACTGELVSALVDQIPICTCSACKGLLLDSAEFSRVVESRRSTFRGEEIDSPPPSPGEFRRRLICPGCHHPMEVHPYYGAGRAVIDSCASCSLIWIDHGELYGLERSIGRRRIPEPLLEESALEPLSETRLSIPLMTLFNLLLG